ncbi:MAG: methionyl-tRNA formyltransferase [Candidatus Sulfotelmatobacter sp.]
MSQSLNLVFCGTPRFAVPTLEKLAASGFKILLVVTQPDRPKGRGLELVQSPIKQFALQLGLPITQPDKIKTNDEFRAQLTTLKPDAIVIVGYGRIIPPWMLALPPLGNINLHASLLPKYRGAAPIQWAIARGETVTGVTTMRIDAGLDTGDILLQRELPVAPEDTAETISPRLAAIGAELTVETMRGLHSGSIHPRSQNHAHATLAPILKKTDGSADFSLSATEIVNRIRGFQPWPGVYTKFRGKTLQIWKARPFDKVLPLAQLHAEGDRLLVGCGSKSSLELLELQLEGKKRMSASDFLHGYRPKPAESLG